MSPALAAVMSGVLVRNRCARRGEENRRVVRARSDDILPVKEPWTDGWRLCFVEVKEIERWSTELRSMAEL